MQVNLVIHCIVPICFSYCLLFVFPLKLAGPFKRGLVSHAQVPTRAKSFRSVMNRTRKSIFWLHVLLHNGLCLIKIYAYSHVTIILTTVVDYEIKITCISILIKLLILYRNLSPVYRHLKLYLHIQGTIGVPDWRKPATCKQLFFQNKLV